MKMHVIALRYVIFALIATTINLVAQRLVLLTGDGALNFAAAVALGTLAGLVAKYFLDKNWIFYDPAEGAVENGKQFSLYAIMGLATTAIFWGFETAAWLMWQTNAAREIGAILGLAIGYLTKYNLDRRFVFSNAHAKASP